MGALQSPLSEVPDDEHRVLEVVTKLYRAQGTLEQLADQELIDDAFGWVGMQGVATLQRSEVKRSLTLIPLAFVPAPLPVDAWNEARQIAPDFHELLDAVVCDLAFLQNSLERRATLDTICSRLLLLCDRVYRERNKNHSKDIRLHIVRNDFVLDGRCTCSTGALRHSEMCTSTDSLASHEEAVANMHRYVLAKGLQRVGVHVDFDTIERVLPAVDNARGIADAISEAHKAYLKRWPSVGRSYAVLFVTGSARGGELGDRKVEAALYSVHHILSMRRSLATLGTKVGKLLVPFPSNPEYGGTVIPKALVVDGCEISVACFRSGWSSGSIDLFDMSWVAREAIETSEAVKCPSALAQLAGMLKVQQVLSSPEELERFVGLPKSELLLQTFIKQQCDPSDENSKFSRECIRASMENPHRWVVKHQESTRGIFDAAIPRLFCSNRPDKLVEYILMDRIDSPPAWTLVHKMDGAVQAVLATAELSIYGAYVVDGKKVLQNKVIGHLVRTADADPGGVFHSILNSPLLLPPSEFWDPVCLINRN